MPECICGIPLGQGHGSVVHFWNKWYIPRWVCALAAPTFALPWYSQLAKQSACFCRQWIPVPRDSCRCASHSCASTQMCGLQVGEGPRGGMLREELGASGWQGM